jgi:hypothetical protein
MSHAGTQVRGVTLPRSALNHTDTRESGVRSATPGLAIQTAPDGFMAVGFSLSVNIYGFLREPQPFFLRRLCLAIFIHTRKRLVADGGRLKKARDRPGG